MRLGMVRGFASWLAERDPQSEVPPAGLIVGRYVRSQPYIFSQPEIAALIDAAGRLPSAYGLRALVWQTLFGLIAVTGLRVNEALGIETKDIDFENNVCVSGPARAVVCALFLCSTAPYSGFDIMLLNGTGCSDVAKDRSSGKKMAHRLAIAEPDTTSPKRAELSD